MRRSCAQSINDTAERHLLGDVPALILVAVMLAVLVPRTAQHSGRDNLARPDLKRLNTLFRRYWQASI